MILTNSCLTLYQNNIYLPLPINLYLCIYIYNIAFEKILYLSQFSYNNFYTVNNFQPERHCHLVALVFIIMSEFFYFKYQWKDTHCWNSLKIKTPTCSDTLCKAKISWNWTYEWSFLNVFYTWVCKYSVFFFLILRAFHFKYLF